MADSGSAHLPGVISYPLQQTVADAVVAHGIGVHTGGKVQLVIRPAPPDSGFVFRRIDLPGSQPIPVHVDNVQRTLLATTLSAGEAEVTTVEHLLSGLICMGVDNATIEVDSFEVPIFDGSAAPVVDLVMETGLTFQRASRKRLRVTHSVEVEADGASIRVDPSPALVVDYTLDYDHPQIGLQRVLYLHSPARYRREIAQARTFSRLEDVQKMRALNLARGGSLQNAVVYTDEGVANQEGLRYPDESARHKLLDLLGDFALLGGEIVGRITACKSGHELNRQAVRKLLEEEAVFPEEVLQPVLETLFDDLEPEGLELSSKI